mmetsp:Transcript_473/g.987  ORF Transcript_473/g.987 Transcript_473/m.987 type:complete len:558 (-) Transcript_473:295-1968(-)
MNIQAFRNGHAKMNLQVFKNGYALVSKTYNLPPSQEGGKATFSLGEPPKHACHGTVWLTASNETTVLGMRAESSTTTEAVLCTSVPSLLRANKGSMVSVKLQGGWVDGKVIDVSGGLEELGLGLLSLACMEDGTSSGKVMAIPLQDIMRVNGTDGQFKLSTDEKKVQKAVIVDYEGAGGAASLVHLRGGFCWAPSYHWQLHDTDKATLSGNATIMNESEEGGVFDKLQCVVGAPNMKFGRVGDPFLVSGSIEQFLHELSIEGSGQGAAPGYGYGGGGGFGARGAAGGAFTAAYQTPVQQVQVIDPAGFGAAGGEDAEDPGEDSSAAADDVHFLDFENVRLEPKARVSLPIFSLDTAYSNVFRASLGNSLSYVHPGDHDDSAFEVWRALRVTNRSQKPWTTAPVMIMRDGSFIAQGMVPYTPVGSEALVNVTRALNVRCKFEVEEVQGMEAEVLMGKEFGVKFKTTTIKINNGKPQDIELIIDYPAFGLLVESSIEPRKNVEANSRSEELNRKRNLQYMLTVPAGAVQHTIAFKTKLYYVIPSNTAFGARVVGFGQPQ